MHIVIVGNGVSGITAARTIRQISDHAVTVISAESEYFFSRTALMYVYMGHMLLEDLKPYEDWFWSKNRIELIKARVQSVSTESKQLKLDNGQSIQFDKLIIASGSKSNKFGWPGQNLKGVQGLYSLQDLESMEAASTPKLKHAVIVGGGLIGIEMVEMFHSRHIPTTFLVREANYWDNVLPFEESKLITDHIRAHGIDLRLESELEEILDDGNGHVAGVKTKRGEKIECQFVGLTVGVSPNIDFLEDAGIRTNRGVVVNEYLQTNIDDIYAIGDCAEIEKPEPSRRPIEAIWYTGRMMGETVAYTICRSPIIYKPGIWFNSAKFFDIEYQVYGNVPTILSDNQHIIFWQHQDGKKSIRIVYDRHTEVVLGFNLLGIRYRQEVCQKWIQENALLDFVLENLSLANFDAEFTKQYEAELLKQYNKQTGNKLEIKNKRALDRVIRFLKNK